ncbi:MAG TPA: SurA N-terminal domain-containing protein [Candidatus Paceibacterota bacterium]|nr:SurA N-terminal domain-containing protein [Candidatus Paceibacterota bacterium]
MKNKKQIVIPIVILIVAGLVSFLVIKGDIFNGGNTVATVNGEKITQKEFDLTKQQLSSSQASQITEQQIVDQMVINELLVQEAKNEGFETTQEEVDEQYQSIITQAGGQEVFNKSLEQLGVTEKYIKDDIEKQLLVQKFADKQRQENDFSVTEEEASTYYDQLSSQQEGVPPYEEVKEQIKSQLSQQKLNNFILNIASQLKEKADINVSL